MDSKSVVSAFRRTPAPAEARAYEVLKPATVHWLQGVELYNIARRAKKDVVLLVYAGEDDGLRKKANQLDYHRRIVQWFRHYLKNEPAPTWMTKGVSYLDIVTIAAA